MSQTAQASLFPAKQPSVQGPWPLPSEWKWVSLEALGTIVEGGTPSKSKPEYWNGTIPWVSPKDMKSLEIADTQDHVSELGIERSATKLLLPGTVLIVFRSGIFAHTLPVAFASRPLTVNQDLKAIIPHKRFDPKYIVYALNARAQSILSRCVKKGATVHSLDGSHFWSEHVPLPFPGDTSRSFNIQRRLVARIETLLAEVNEARTLATAIRRDTDRIMEAITEEILGRLGMAQFDSLIASYRNGIYKPEHYYGRGYPSVRMFNIKDGRVGLENAPLLDVTPEELEIYGLVAGDILVNRVNSRELVGKTGLVPPDIGFCTFESKNIRVRVNRKLAEPAFIVAALNSSAVKRQILQKQKPAIGQATVNQDDLNALQIPFVADLGTQRQIATHLDSIRAKVADMRRLQAHDAELLDQLKQSILEHAFRGEL